MPFSRFITFTSLAIMATHSLASSLRIEFQAAMQVVAVHWAGACAGPRLRHVYRCVTELVHRTDAHRVLFDNRERDIIDQEDAQWVATEAYSAMLAGRSRPLRLAYVVPPMMHDAYEPGYRQTNGELLQIGLFRRPAEAMVWLLAD